MLNEPDELGTDVTHLSLSAGLRYDIVLLKLQLDAGFSSGLALYQTDTNIDHPQVATLGRVQSRMEAAQRQSLETMERFEVGQLRAGDAGRRRQPVVAPAILAGTLSAAAVVAVAWALGLFAFPSPRPPPPPATAESAPPEAKSATTQPKPAADATSVANEAKPARSEPPASRDASSAQISADAAAEAETAPTDAAATVESKSAQINPGDSAADAGAVAAGDGGTAPQAATSAPPARKRAAGPSSQAAMLHALALSQVRRGEAALEQGNTDDALASFRAALENEPTIAVAFRGLGMAYAMQGHDGEALQAYDKYLRLSPKASDAPEIRKSIRELRTRAKGAE